MIDFSELEKEWQIYRYEDSSATRKIEARMSIDPGFVNHRKVQSVLGDEGIKLINDLISRNVSDKLPEGLKQTQIDHMYTKVILDFCKVAKIKTFGETYANKKGTLFCSTEYLSPVSNIYDVSRAECFILHPENQILDCRLVFSTNKVKSDTLRSQLARGGSFALIAEMTEYRDGNIRYEPLVIGSPVFAHLDEQTSNQLMWLRNVFNEVFIEDIEEFKLVAANNDVPFEEWKVMEMISERAFKLCLAEILNVIPAKDWGGEASDMFSSLIHLGPKRLTGAFVLKGPASFREMSLNHLGKNNDQIVRLANEPAEILFVQHCHEISSAVRATLRAFAVQPSNPRRYCLIDGKDSYRLLKTYNLLEKALKLSEK